MQEKKKRSPLSFIVGLIVLSLALVGIISIFHDVSENMQQKKQQEQLLEFSEYEEFLTPIVMYDPDTFDDITGANEDQLISIAIWSLLDSDINTDTYEYGDSGLIIPKKDVEESFARLFGNELTPEHRSVDGGGISFSYSEGIEGYIIPITGVTPIYTPRVTELVRRESSLILTVGYLASTDWVQDSLGNMVEPEPAKYMKLTLGKSSDGSYYLRAIQNAD